MKEESITFRLATENDIDAVYRVMTEVYEAMENKALFVCDDYDYVKNCILKSGFCVVACDGDLVVGDFIFRYPGLDADNLGRDLGLSESDLLKVIHTESCTVLPSYRGLGLQSRMLAFALSIIDSSRFSYLCATVSPDNPASFKSLEKNGFKHMLTKEKYGGLMRRIYLKEI